MEKSSIDQQFDNDIIFTENLAEEHQKRFVTVLPLKVDTLKCSFYDS
jgi:hypothetical protein